ncbi:MAG: hypothetical protein H6843_08940 [Rhodospirillaceae bacterium]|nr:hypothetical protein [Rhodospirillaceae bacterium]
MMKSGITKRAAIWTSLVLGLAACANQSSPEIAPIDSGRSAGASPAPGLALGTTEFQPAGVTFGSDTGTAVGARVQDLQAQLAQLQGSIGQENADLQQIRTESISTAQDYFGLVAAINARLQVGTTPGNPILVQQFGQAQSELERFGSQISTMNALATDVASTSATAAFLLESVRATYGLTGAVDEDHRNLNILEDEVNRTVVLIDRLLTELSEDLNRQTTYLANERENLQTLQVAVNNGELYGLSLANRAYITSVPQLASAARTPELSTIGAATGQRPLVVIRFTTETVDYAQPLYQAVSGALDRRPQAVFDVVAVSPQGGSPGDVALAANRARNRAQEVLRTLVDLGLPPSRATISSAPGNVEGPEVHVYVR